MSSGPYQFVWAQEGESYEGHIKRGEKLIATLRAPFDYQIADGSHTFQCSKKADSAGGNGPSATARAAMKCENGARLDARVEVSSAPGEEGVFVLRTRTAVLAGVGDGIAQQLRFSLPPDPAAEALIPGVWYKRNEHVEDCGPSLSGGTSFHVREDRATYPAVSLRAAGETVTLFRDRAAQFDAEASRDDSPARSLLAGNALYTTSGGGTDMAGVGFDLAPKSPTVTAHFPYFEGPYSMQLRGYAAEATPLFDSYCRYHAVQGYLDWDLVKQTGLESTWRLILTRQENFGDLMADHWRWALAAYEPQTVMPATTGAGVRNALAEFVAGHYDHSSALAGFFYVMSVPSATVLLPYFEPGFTGRAFLNARFLLAAGRENERPDWIAKAESVFDTWIAEGTQGGYFYDLWDARRGRPASDRSLNGAPTEFAIRRESEAVWALLEAVADEERRGFPRGTWKSALRAHLDGLARLAQSDGSFCRRYSFAGDCTEPNAGGTSSAVPPLVHGYRMFKEPLYLQRAEAAARYVVASFIEPSDYFASTIDNPSENKEAATYAFYAARLLCEEKCASDGRWLLWATQAADAALTWIQMTDVPFYEPTPFARLGFKTRGLGNVAAGGGNLDAYAFEFPGSLIWLARQSGDSRYEEMARLILGAAMNTVSIPNDRKGLGQIGLAPEGLQKTIFSYFAGGKGSYAPFSALGWTTASVFQAMDEVERASGKSVDAFIAMK